MTRSRCRACGLPVTVESVRRGRETRPSLWAVHVHSGKVPCTPDPTRCPVGARRHVLADGTLCPDPRHEDVSPVSPLSPPQETPPPPRATPDSLTRGGQNQRGQRGQTGVSPATARKTEGTTEGTPVPCVPSALASSYWAV